MVLFAGCLCLMVIKETAAPYLLTPLILGIILIVLSVKKSGKVDN